ncbi:MAG: hypothetical protein AAGF11_55150, partial [Myxococcota bacterium]
MYCLISVVIRDWSAVYDEAQSYKRRALQAATAAGVERPPVFRATKGLLLVVDWDGERVIGALELPKPTGFLLDEGRLRVALWEDDEIATLRNGVISERIRHPWFNHIHTLERTPRGLLVSSSGTDLLAEVDEHGELSWSFFMFEHGYDDRRFRFGSSFDRSLDYNRRYLPAALTTHPNSAIRVDDHTVLATLFSTGELVKIDSDRGHVEVIESGLKRPHSIRRRPGGGYMLSDTEAGRVLLLGPTFDIEQIVPVDVPWIQDAVFAGERLLVVGNRRIIMHSQAAGGHNYVLEVRGPEAPR